MGCSLTVSIAFFLDELPFVEGLPSNVLKNYTRKFVDQWCSMANMTPIWIDGTKTLRKTNKNVFYSWSEMIANFPDHNIIFLDPNGNEYLDEIEHPKDKVIYCIGADEEKGFGDLNINGFQSVKLRRYGNWHGFNVVPIVVAARMK